MTVRRENAAMTTPASSPAQDWQPARYAEQASFVPALARDLVTWLRPRAGERVLDLGCGTGVLTAAIAAAGATVVGVDASPAMVEAARAVGVDAQVAHAETLPFEGAFDAVFSNAMLHWTRDIDAVLRGVHRALRPDGRFVAELGGKGNVAGIVDAARGVLETQGIALPAAPWYFPSLDDMSEALRRAGFRVEQIVLFGRPTPLPGGIVEWLETFGGPLLQRLAPQARTDVARAIEDRLAPTHRGADGVWVADYVRLRFIARRV
jgi:SAM-dependent methyltransferase